MKKGGLDVQFFSVWTGEKPRRSSFYADALEMIDSLERITLRNYDRMTLATTYKQVRQGLRQDKLVALIGVEGGHMIEADMEKFMDLYSRGMRYLTLTWNNSHEWASSGEDETLRPDSLKQKGLSPFGKDLIRKMNELGVIVDLSHVGVQTFYNALSVTTKPVMLSHSSVYAIAPHFRNINDDQIRAIGKNNGVVCINFYSGFIDSAFTNKMTELQRRDRRRIQDSLRTYHDAAKMNEIWRQYFESALQPFLPDVSDVADHIDHVVKIAGVNHVGIGSDYDGISFPPRGLEDVTTYPNLTAELVRRGYSKKDIKKILGGNVLRVMKENLPAN